MDKFFAVVFNAQNESIHDVSWCQTADEARDRAYEGINESDPEDNKLFKILVFSSDDAIYSEVYDVSAEGQIFRYQKSIAPANK